MKVDIKTLIKVYNGSNEIQKLLFLDVLNDLIKWVFQFKEAKKTPYSIYIEKLAQDTVKNMNFESIKEYQTFINDLNNFIHTWTNVNGKNVWIFNVTKPRNLLSKEIKVYYHQIWEEELEEIQSYRKLLLNNFIAYWAIEIFTSKNDEYNKMCKDFEKSITKINEKNRKVLIWISKIKDPATRNYLQRLEVDYWIEKVNKWFEHLFNDIELENYLTHKKDLELLYNKITGKEIQKEYTEFLPKEWILRYNWKSITFELDKNPYLLLKILFQNKDKNIWIDKVDLYKYIENTDSIQLYYKNKNIINDLKNWINRRFKNEFHTNKLFLRFKNWALYREI